MTRKFTVDQNMVADQAASIARCILNERLAKPSTEPLHIFGIPRGGVPAAHAVLRYLPSALMVNEVEDAHVIIDDLIDSGATMDRYRAMNPDALCYALFTKTPNEDRWYVFPWEKDETGSAEDIPTRLLQFIGEDPKRGGLLETPARFLKAWKHYTSGYGVDPRSILKTFEDGADNYDGMLLVRDIPVYSHCEHHLAPFFGTASVAYIPNGRIIGLSKIPRLVNIFARRLQVQERLTTQIADAMNEILQPKGVAVIIKCRHMCMEARGIERLGTDTVTHAVRGLFLTNPAVRAEFFEGTKS